MENKERLGPFVEAVVVTLREMAGLEAAARQARQSTGREGCGDVSASLRLEAGGEGWLVLSFPLATATAIAGRVLGDAAELNDEMVRDCAGELANVVAGQAKAMLFGMPGHFTFSTPIVVAGPPAIPDGGTWLVHFVTEVGEFSLHLQLPG